MTDVVLIAAYLAAAVFAGRSLWLWFDRRRTDLRSDAAAFSCALFAAAVAIVTGRYQLEFAVLAAGLLVNLLWSIVADYQQRRHAERAGRTQTRSRGPGRVSERERTEMHYYDQVPGWASVLGDVVAECRRQDAKWGPNRRYRYGTGRSGDVEAAAAARARCRANSPDEDNWRDILDEEVAEAWAETDPAALRRELIQTIAVGLQFVAAIDRDTRDGGDQEVRAWLTGT